MIRSLRARHRRMVPAVGLCAGFLAVLALLGRRSVSSDEIPAVLFEARTGIAPAAGDMRCAVDVDRAGHASVTVHAPASGDGTEIGVFWAPDAAVSGARLPERSYWLGRHAGPAPRTYSLPPSGLAAHGALFLYDFERQQIVGVAELSLPPEAGGGVLR